MKRTLKESVRDIRNMIGRIDHPTIVEAPEPGDEEVDDRDDVEKEGDIGADEVEKGINIVNVPPAKTYQLEKQVFSKLEDYQKANNPSAVELFKKINSKGIKSTNDFKSGEFFNVLSILNGGKTPFSFESNLGKDYKLKVKKEILPGVIVKTDFKLKQKTSGLPNIADGFKFGGANASLVFKVKNQDKAKIAKKKFKSKGYEI